MKIKQFNDGPLAHYSYVITVDDKMILIDPSRNPMQYYKLAEDEGAEIVAVLETHPHADFVSGHAQIHEETEAKIYVSEKVDASYPHEALKDGDSFKINNVTIQAIFTPGHSPDSLSYHVYKDDEHYVFTGDCLFIGDVGRPDLREKKGDNSSKAKELAKAMYHTIQNKYNDLPDHTIVYPAHGAGSLCGKNMSSASKSTMGKERESNWAFNTTNEEEFISTILDDQPFIPSYFKYDVETNLSGADNHQKSKYSVPLDITLDNVKNGDLIVDVRDEQEFKKDHLEGSINIMARSESDKFETWLGSIIKPDEKFTLIVPSIEKYDEILDRVAKIGYEKNLEKIGTYHSKKPVQDNPLNLEHFKNNQDAYNIVDIRNESEADNNQIFEKAVNLPLHSLRDNIDKIDTNKPVVVHCAGGYRSATGYSIIQKELKETDVYDLSQAIKTFK